MNPTILILSLSPSPDTSYLDVRLAEEIARLDPFQRCGDSFGDWHERTRAMTHRRAA